MYEARWRWLPDACLQFEVDANGFYWCLHTYQPLLAGANFGLRRQPSLIPGDWDPSTIFGGKWIERHGPTGGHVREGSAYRIHDLFDFAAIAWEAFSGAFLWWAASVQPHFRAVGLSLIWLQTTAAFVFFDKAAPAAQGAVGPWAYFSQAMSGAGSDGGPEGRTGYATGWRCAL